MFYDTDNIKAKMDDGIQEECENVRPGRDKLCRQERCKNSLNNNIHSGINQSTREFYSSFEMQSEDRETKTKANYYR